MRIFVSSFIVVLFLLVAGLSWSSPGGAPARRPLDLPVGTKKIQKDELPPEIVRMHGTKVEGDVFLFVLYTGNDPVRDCLITEIKRAVKQLSPFSRMNFVAATPSGPVRWADDFAPGTRSKQVLASRWLAELEPLTYPMPFLELGTTAQRMVRQAGRGENKVVILSANLVPPPTGHCSPDGMIEFGAPVHCYTTGGEFWQQLASLTGGMYCEVFNTD